MISLTVGFGLLFFAALLLPWPMNLFFGLLLPLVFVRVLRWARYG